MADISPRLLRQQPTTFQKQVYELSLDEFETMTNIKDIVLKRYEQKCPGKEMLPELCKENVEKYYNNLHVFHKWPQGGLDELVYTTPVKNSTQRERRKSTTEAAEVSFH